MRFRDQWTYDDLKAFVDAADSEHLNFDFKAMAALDQTQGKKKEAAKDASAFANAAGGIIVYGVAEQCEGTYSIQQGFEPSGKISKEWLQAVLDQNIAPPITGLEAFSVELPDSGGRFALLVQIPRAEVEPHQAPDRRYYVRRGDHNAIMTHQEVRDTFFRTRDPQLTATLDIAEVYTQVESHGFLKLSAAGALTLRNRGGVLAHEFFIRFTCPPGVHMEFSGSYGFYFDKYKDVTGRHFCVRSLGRCAPPYQPIPVPPLRCFPGEEIPFDVRFHLGRFETARWSQELPMLRQANVEWDMYTDNAPKRTGSFKVGDILPPSVQPAPDHKVTREDWTDPRHPWPNPIELR